MGERVNSCLLCKIRRRENRLRAGKADQTPPGEVLVAAVERIGEHPFHRVRPKDAEKLPGSGISEPGCLVAFERRDHFVLLFRAEPHEWLFMSATAVRFELCQAAPVEILQLGVSAGEREINVIEHVGVARSRLAGRAGHDPFGKRRDRGGVGMVEERAMLAAARMLRAGSCGAAFHLLVILGDRVRNETRSRSGSRANRRAH